MSLSRGGGYRRYGNTNRHRQPHQIDENGTLIVRPIQSHETSSSPSTLESSSSSHPVHHKRPQFRRNLRGGSRNRGGKSVFVKKFEKENEEEEDMAEDSNSTLNIDSNCGYMNGKEECSVLRSVSGLNNNDDEIEEKGQKITEGLNSSDEIDEYDTFKRLKELRLRVELPEELSEELLAINQQLQEDELLAMESIYEDNIVILDNDCGLKCFEVYIHVEVPEGLHISSKFNSSNFNEKRDDDDISDFSYTFQVEYLPPIVLTCLLPKSYPSKCSPCFTIAVQWLGSAKISDLCRKLDSIWLEQAGQEVIYPWVEWLHGCTLSYLGFDSEIILGPYGLRYVEDKRAISGSVSPNIDIPSMKSYNDEKLYENFCKNIQECSICLSEFAGSEFIRLPCRHFFCEKCVKKFTEINVMDGTVLKVKCPESKCDGVIPPSLIKRLLGEEEFERWESLTLQRTLESMKDVVYCPRCETACLEDEDHEAQCSKCYYSFCTLCNDRRHVGVTCMTTEMKLIVLQERQNSNLLNSDQRRREKDVINEILSVGEIKRFAKQCPSCKMAIERTEGCNKMVCSNCFTYFCYRCNKAISGYDHFSAGASCELFSKEEIQRWEERMNVRQNVGRHVAADARMALQVHPCPACRQPNVKEGNNNHMWCWACQNHYCYLCRKMVRRSAQHYGPKGCKQHTVG